MIGITLINAPAKSPQSMVCWEGIPASPTVRVNIPSVFVAIKGHTRFVHCHINVMIARTA